VWVQFGSGDKVGVGVGGDEVWMSSSERKRKLEAVQQGSEVIFSGSSVDIVHM
jgi:hypothetical protein